MQKTTIVTNLSKKSINETKKILEQYKLAILKSKDNSIKALTEQAYNLVVMHCMANGIINHTSEIKVEYGSDYGKIYTNDEVIIFNEMGTGIVGKNNPHPKPTPEFSQWTYDVNEHGEKGWKYPKDDGTFGWTKGLPSRHMFYDTFNEIKDMVGKTVSIEIYKTTKDLY